MNNQDIKIIFSDMDGTLLNREAKLSQRTVDTVKAVTERGVRFVLVSARSFEAMRETYAALSLDTPAVSISGAAVVNCKGKLLKSVEMERGAVSDIVDFLYGRFPDVECGIYGYDSWFMENTDSEMNRIETKYTGISAVKADFSEILKSGMPVLKLLLKCGADTQATLIETLSCRFPDTSFAPSSSFYVEVTDKRVDKSVGVRYVCDYCKISEKQSICFGDSGNDLPMLRIAGRSYAMENACDFVKAQCDFVAPAHYCDGVAQVLEALFKLS